MPNSTILSIDAAAEFVPSFLAEWGERSAELHSANVLLQLWRWWLRRTLAAAFTGCSAPPSTEAAVEVACRRWALARWEPSLEREFLARHDQYHLLRYSQLRVLDKDLAHELAFQLREHEADFPALNFIHGQAPERKRGGLMPDLPLVAIPQPIANVLLGLRPGQVVGPLRFGQEFLVLRLDASTPAVLDQSMRERLLQDLLEEWLALGDTALLAALDSTPQPLGSNPE